MADNITAKGNVGAGTEVIAADDISGVLYPRTKLVIGADGVNDGDISAANPMPVSGAVTVAGAATETTLALVRGDLDMIESYFKAEDTAHASGDKGMPLLAIRYLSLIHI